VVGSQARSSVHSLVSGVQVVCMWVWTHWPISQPALVHRFPSVSAHGVLSGTGGCGHRPVAGSQARSVVPSLVSGVQVFCMGVWTHCPFSQPALVQALLSVSPHGVLSCTFVGTHWPVV